MSGILFNTNNKDPFVWEILDNSNRLDELMNDEGYVLIFKHSTRCGTSSMALTRFEKEWDRSQKCKLVFLDLLKHRSLSDEIANRTRIIHESPQVILLCNSKVIYHESHSGISAGNIEKMIEI